MSAEPLGLRTSAASGQNYKLQEVIKTISNHLQYNTEESSVALTRHFQALGAVTDTKTFDPRNNVVTQFFVSLYELAGKMDYNSPFVWYFVEVLSNACHNSETRQALIHTYQFVPSLARLLGDHLTRDKTVRLLKLLQDLTCGIKMSWQIPHLVHLMRTLVSWMEGADMEIKTLSVGVLANLCYENLPAMYTLMGIVDMKKIMRICTILQDGGAEIHTFKLLMVLDSYEWTNTSSSHFVCVTFTSAIEAYRTRNRILLNQVVDFFIEMAEKHDLGTELFSKFCQQRFKELFTALQSDTAKATEGNFDDQLYECVALVLRFFGSIVAMCPQLTSSCHDAMIEITLKWIESNETSSPSLKLLNEIAAVAEATKNGHLASLSNGLPLFNNLLRQKSGQVGLCTEEAKKTTGLLKLLSSLLRVKSLKDRVLGELEVEVIRNVFVPFLDNDGQFVDTSAPQIDLCSNVVVELYVNAAALVHELCKNESKWLSLQTEIFQNYQMHMILARGLYAGSKDVITAILKLRGSAAFPTDGVADVMLSLQKDVVATPGARRAAVDVREPLLGVAQLRRIDEVLDRLRRAAEVPGAGNAAVCDVMQLYEYKLVSVGHAERTALAGVEAASERCTQLQHRNAELLAALDRHHQLLFHAQRCVEQRAKTETCMKKNMDSLDRKLALCEANRAELVKSLENSSAVTHNLEQQLRTSNEAYSKSKESAANWERLAQEREDYLKRARDEIDELKLVIKEKDSSLTQMSDKISSMKKDLDLKNSIIDTITKVATQNVE